MNQKQASRGGTWLARSVAVALSAGLAAAIGLSATPASAAPYWDGSRAPSVWDGNGAPPFLKTAPTGTKLGAPAKNTIWPCPYVIPIPGTDDTGTIGQTIATEITEAQTPWVRDSRIDVSKIALVPGAVKMRSVFSITKTKTTRTLMGNGIPNHPIGTFPIPRSSEAYKYYAALPAEGYPGEAV